MLLLQKYKKTLGLQLHTLSRFSTSIRGGYGGMVAVEVMVAAAEMATYRGEEGWRPTSPTPGAAGFNEIW